MPKTKRKIDAMMLGTRLHSEKNLLERAGHVIGLTVGLPMLPSREHVEREERKALKGTITERKRRK